MQNLISILMNVVYFLQKENLMFELFIILLISCDNNIFKIQLIYHSK